MATPDYATRDDVVRSLAGVARLVQLADHDNDGDEDPGLVDQFICKAEAFVNGYLRKKRSVPLQAPVPQIIVDTVADLAVFYLKAAKPGGLTPQDTDLQADRVRWLEGVASGKIDLGVQPVPQKSSLNSPRATERPSSKERSRDKLNGVR